MEKFFDLLRFSLNGSTQIPQSMANGAWTADDWKDIRLTAMKQTVTGLIFNAIERLPKELQPPKSELMLWIVMAMQLKRRNTLLYSKTVELQRILSGMGLDSCVLKGQGNAIMYANAYIRTPGDIDVWTTGRKKDVVRMIRSRYPDVADEHHHIDFPVFSDVQVEVHHFPSYLFNLINNKRLQRYYDGRKQSVMGNFVDAPNGLGRFSVPDACFNAVFQLTHIFRHLLVQGVGLRQLADYYYVLKNIPDDDNQKRKLAEMFKYFGLYSFASAVMYVEQEWLGLDQKYLIVPTDRRRGTQLMECILYGGNFGKYDKDSWLHGKGLADRQVRKFRRSMMFIFSYPEEVLWEPVFRVYFFIKRKFNLKS